MTERGGVETGTVLAVVNDPLPKLTVRLPGDLEAIVYRCLYAFLSPVADARGWIRPDGRPVGDLPASLFTPAMFLAFLATNGATAARFVSKATPIVRLDGLRVADSFSALISQDLSHPPNVRISGPPDGFRVFTGASSPTSAGTAATTCNNWSTVGTPVVEQGFAERAALVDPDSGWFNNSVNTDAFCSDYTQTGPGVLPGEMMPGLRSCTGGPRHSARPSGWWAPGKVMATV